MNDLKEEIQWLNEPEKYDEKTVQKLISKAPGQLLVALSGRIEELSGLENLKDTLMTWAKSNDVPVGFMMQSLRISLVGALSGPDLFEICNILGKDVILKRINSAISFFNQKT